MRAILIALLLTISSSALAETRILIFSGMGDFAGLGVGPLAERLRRCGRVSVMPHMASPDAEVRSARSGRVVLIGHSMGGATAARLAVQHKLERRHLVVTLDSHFASYEGIGAEMLVLNQSHVPAGHVAFAMNSRVMEMVARRACR